MRVANVLLSSLIAVPLASCFGGEIGGGKRLRVSGDETPVATDGGTVIDQPGRDGGVGSKPPPPPPPPNAPRDAGVVVMPFTHATAGDRCVDDRPEAALVLSDKPLSCPEWAALATTPTGRVAVASLASVSGPGTHQLPVTVCLDGCATFTMSLVVDTITTGTSLLGSYTIDVDGARITGDVDASWCAQSGAGAPAATDLTISEVAAYQAVKISMMENGSEVTGRNAPLLEGKRALVRVSVEPGAGFTAREILGRLDIDGDVVEARQTIRGGSSDGDMSSTINFDVPSELVQLGATWAVSLHESGPSQCDPSGGAQNRFPASGTADLGVESSGGNFKIVIVPVRYNSDGSGRLPDLDPAQLQNYVDRSFAIFPATDVEVTVRDPMDWNSAVRASGAGWSALLGAIADLRSRDDVPSNVYYFGSFRPRNTFGAFCGGGCVAGLGNVPGANDTYSRTSIGLGFSGQGSVETYTHEVGHSLGRGHAPCGVSGDGSFPYRGARIGVWGYHLVEDDLMDPADWRDMMSYCDPQWISDYYYERIHRRIEHANTTVRFNLTGGNAPTSTYRVLVLDRFEPSWGTEGVTLAGEPGEPIAVTLYKNGSRRDITAFISRFDHLDGGFVYLPDPLEADEVEVEGFGRLHVP